MEIITIEKFKELHSPNRFPDKNPSETAYKLGAKAMIEIISKCYPDGIKIVRE